MTHLSTDGENKNVGQHTGLWKLLENALQKLKLQHIPLLKSVCAVHSSALAYKDLCKSVCEIPALLSTLSGLSTFFHTSARRTADLDQIAADNNLTVRRFPKLYEVRWSEFTTALLDSVLVSWKVLMKYFTSRSQTASDGDESRFRIALTKVDNVRLCFLADLLFLLQNFQKKLQSDSITIIDLKPQLSVFIQKVIATEKAPLLGGCEEVLAREMQTVEGQ